jgi:hypothetical protein
MSTAAFLLIAVIAECAVLWLAYSMGRDMAQ